ncbi:hypothetical protein MKW92_017085 [Papaver armeniacum]|nr:hypothetical protein MKW92_017085 [Papaver armeniacum]
MKTLTSSSGQIHLHLLLIIILLSLNIVIQVRSETPQELLKGFTATPDSSISSFQPLLNDPTGDFSLGFLRIEDSKLALAILHVPSSEPIWLANTTGSLRWSKATQLSFNGSLVLSDSHSNVFWSTGSVGDRVLLMHDSNLQVQKLSGKNEQSIVWQSYDFPFDTLIESQNFTVSMSLVSKNGLYSMRLGDTYYGLYSKVNTNSTQLYWKHGAMEAKAEIVEGNGPIYARISPNGYLGMYQTLKAPVDILPFDSFQRPVPGIRKLKLESDGNLRGYYWSGTTWVLDFKAISDVCELPNACGSYGLCQPGKGCSCLDNKTRYNSGECFPHKTGDFCSKNEVLGKGYWILRRKGVEVPHKEWMGFEKMETLNDCEDSCERNCSCWGAVYNNVTKFCYKIQYPISSLVSDGDEGKSGFFKVKNEEKKRVVSVAVGLGLIIGAVIVLVLVVGFVIFSIWRRRKNQSDRLLEDGLSPGSYKGLDSESFRSVELSQRPS